MAEQQAIPTMLQQSRIEINNLNLSGLEIILDYLPRDATNVMLSCINLRDVQQLRLCSRRLAGSPELHGLIRDPGRLNRLGAQCQGRLGSWIWDPAINDFRRDTIQCPNGPTSTSIIRYCENPLRWCDFDPSKNPKVPLPPQDGRLVNFCYSCTGAAAMVDPRPRLGTGWDVFNKIGFTTEPLCNTCSADQIAQHPEGCNTCTCMDKIRQKWRCRPCSEAIARGFLRHALERRSELRRMYTRIIIENNVAPLDEMKDPTFLACPKCNQRGSGTRASEVAMCLECDGIVYEPRTNLD